MGTIQKSIQGVAGAIGQAAVAAKVGAVAKEAEKGNIIQEGEKIEKGELDVAKGELELNQTERDLAKAEAKRDYQKEQLTRAEAKHEERLKLEREGWIVDTESSLEEKLAANQQYGKALSKVDEIRKMREIQNLELSLRREQLSARKELYQKRARKFPDLPQYGKGGKK